MPKKLYGKGANNGARRRAAAEDDSIWVTLIATVPEAELHRSIVAALEDPRAPAGITAEQHDALAASLIEYATQPDRNADCDEAWIGLLSELFADFALSLASDEDVDALTAERQGAEELLRCLKLHKALCAEPPPPPPLALGDAVLAVLEEDGEWHEAVVVEIAKATGLTGPPRVAVRFTEWPKVQETARTQVVALREAEDDDDADETEGDCEVCGRALQLTFHHLIPKQTHGRYLGKALPAGVAEAAALRGLDPQPSREFLNRHGVMCCRFCHSTIHRLAPNAVLAERFNTLDKLLATSELQRFVAFACRAKLTQRGTR